MLEIPDNLAADVPSLSIGTLKTLDGRYLSVDAGTLVAKPEPDSFAIVATGTDQATLLSMRSNAFVSADADGHVFAVRTAAGPDETFTIEQQGSDGVALRSVHGGYLSVTDEDDGHVTATAERAGGSETFAIEETPIGDEAGSAHSCCCGLRNVAPTDADDIGAATLIWDDRTHRKIVEIAVHRLASSPHATPESRMVTSFFQIPAIPEAVYEYLLLADYDERYAGAKLGPNWFTYLPHFYDPTTGTNYGNGPFTALSYGRQFFNLSVYHARHYRWGGNHISAAVAAAQYLGLALHYLTDLTQPMHAANFTNVFGEFQQSSVLIPSIIDRRHSGFENYADDRVKAGYLDHTQLIASDFEVASLTSVDDLLKSVATEMRDVFYRHVLAPARKKRLSPGIYAGTWGQEADAGLDRSLKRAPNITARFLNFWARCVERRLPGERAINPQSWYRIYDPTSDYKDCVRLHHGYHSVETVTDRTDRSSRFFFIFNHDGTCSLACEAYKMNLWSMWAGATEVYVSENKAGEPVDRSARFRFMPGPDGTVTIFEPGFDMAVGVSRSGISNKYLVRKDPANPREYLFKLEEVGEISDTDRARIRAVWPTYGRGPSVPPT
jgi:hypothetical protein